MMIRRRAAASRISAHHTFLTGERVSLVMSIATTVTMGANPCSRALAVPPLTVRAISRYKCGDCLTIHVRDGHDDHDNTMTLPRNYSACTKRRLSASRKRSASRLQPPASWSTSGASPMPNLDWSNRRSTAKIWPNPTTKRPGSRPVDGVDRWGSVDGARPAANGFCCRQAWCAVANTSAGWSTSSATTVSL